MQQIPEKLNLTPMPDDVGLKRELQWAWQNMAKIFNALLEGRIYVRLSDTTAPTGRSWQRGDIIWNNNPSGTGNLILGWICVTAGEPGTWEEMEFGYVGGGPQIWVGDPGYGPTLQDAITAIGSNQVILYVPVGTYNISADYTIPANIALRPERGVDLAIADTKTLTINGGLDAGLYQIFSCTGTGKVVFGNRTSRVYPEWWGAVADDSTDCSAAIQAAVSSLPVSISPNVGGTVFFSPGKYKRTSTTTLPTGITIEGSSAYGTLIKDYTNGVDGFYAVDKIGITFRNIGLYDAIYNTTRTTGHGIHLTCTTFNSNAYKLDDVYIVGYQDGVNVEKAGYPIFTKVRAVLQVRHSFYFNGVVSTGATLSSLVSASCGGNAFKFVNCTDFTLNSLIGDGSGSTAFYFDTCNQFTPNSCSAENDTAPGTAHGYYLKTCTNFTFNNPRATKNHITDSFYFDSGCSHITVNNPLMDSPTGYAIYLDDTGNQYNIIFVNPLIVTPGVGEIHDQYAAVKRVYPHYTIIGSWTNPYTNYTPAGNTAGVETTLATATIPAGTMDPTSHCSVPKKQALRITAYGTFAANGNAKTVNLYWNTTTLIGQIIGALNNKHWRIEAVVGSDVSFADQEISALMVTNDNAVFPASTTFTNDTMNLATTASVIKLTGNGAGASDVIMKGFVVNLEE